ncbi:YtpR family tRNA-binding protein [Secundilactobacillus malefermentans]|uniref:tRNA-binding domain-containing protein n=1 Tax=Secundilactobacillus malefermentans TaxID=176292 RepID=A0A4R5NLM1_9LACO|nr:DUF4479 and tRNA-binding domain-containing protein [Secundilactobacillus malefermentans]KRM58434.1 hypothetical protein FD44_GL000692 [Secundilactobacillus malefermentans DSM 5705 = KCTC 3548]QEA30740.1 DUF4479 domain-containing protein [Secundilactobacillus malefermentans]TDG75871.1 hypothetical protein C5L31_000647 [Secundilactobacillus malefermentans]
MLISSYNPQELGDTLVVITGEDVENQADERHGNIVRIFDAESGKTIGYNFLAVSDILTKLGNVGQVFLNDNDVSLLNQSLADNQFKPDLVQDKTPKFVVGFVESMEKHPNSDHLYITQTKIDDGKTLQIVSGSPNMQTGIKVAVAKVGAMMPDGLIIWPGELRGVSSIGMICSGRELKIPGAPDVPGAMILPDSFQVGAAFDVTSDQVQHIFA